MNPELQEWLNLFVRWFHVIVGIAWIGQTYLFNRMERELEPPKDKSGNISGEMWMVHGGGFYLVEKQKWPQIMPRTLHWFKWEAALTWITGVILLGLFNQTIITRYPERSPARFTFISNYPADSNRAVKVFF